MEKMHAPFAPGKMPGMLSLKDTVGSIIRVVARVPVVRTLFYHPAVRGRIQVWPGFRRFYGGGWDLRHPFDREYRTDTSGFVPSDRLPSSPHDSKKKNIYAGSQPSIVRLALSALPALPECTFIDLGCGKGVPCWLHRSIRSGASSESSYHRRWYSMRGRTPRLSGNSSRGAHLSWSNNTMLVNFRCPRGTSSFSSTTPLDKKSLPGSSRVSKKLWPQAAERYSFMGTALTARGHLPDISLPTFPIRRKSWGTVPTSRMASSFGREAARHLRTVTPTQESR